MLIKLNDDLVVNTDYIIYCKHTPDEKYQLAIMSGGLEPFYKTINRREFEILCANTEGVSKL